MTDKPTRTLTFGAVGWNDPRLVEALYPEDAPPEWRLSCYTSHFDTVLVPEADWRQATPGVAAAWREELPSQFWFYLLLEEVPDDACLDRLGALVAALGDRLGGVVLAAPAADALDRVRGRAAGTMVCSAVGGAGPGRLWTGAGCPCPCGPVGLVDFAAAPSPRVLRETVEAFLACQDESWSVLFMRAPVGSFDDARVIGQLLGVT
jgi:hypothetical protein